ncbi:MAG: cupin domain-containing protein [Treponema sp.]|nr:cupin domain-containing protein [Treponema sp.]
MGNQEFSRTIQSYLNDNMIVESSPKVEGETNRFWHSDKRGEVAVILDNINVNFLEFAEFAASEIKRGHHYHEKYTEYLYVLSGEVKVIAKSLITEEEISFFIRKGDLLTIKPNIAHGFLSITHAEVLTMGTGSNPFNDRKSFSEFSSEHYSV